MYSCCYYNRILYIPIVSEISSMRKEIRENFIKIKKRPIYRRFFSDELENLMS